MGICSSKTAVQVTVVQPVAQERFYIDYAGQVEKNASQLDSRIASLSTYMLEAFDRANEIRLKKPEGKTPKIKVLAEKARELSESAQKSLSDLRTFFPNLQSVQDGVLQRMGNTLAQQASMILIMQNKIISQLEKE